MQNLLQIISSKVRISEKLESAIVGTFRKETISKNEFLLKEFQYCRRLYFLDKGTVRTFYYHKEKDITSWFYREGHFLTSWYSFYTQKASFEYIETLEECTIYSISYTKYQKLILEFPQFERFARLLAEEQTAFVDNFSKGYMFMSAKEKYDLLLSIFPDITLRVNLGHIASFIGVSQETLSRIRRRKKTKA